MPPARVETPSRELVEAGRTLSRKLAGSIRQAAESLHVAPSAVNRRIQDLEDELGVLLFERLPRGMRLTTAGELFVQCVRGRASALDEVRSQIEELQGLWRGSVRAVASQTLAPQFVPRLVAEFRKTNPLVSFQVRIGDHVQALRALRAFETNVALVFNLAHELDIELSAEAEQRLVAIMHSSHPLPTMGFAPKCTACSDAHPCQHECHLLGRPALWVATGEAAAVELANQPARRTQAARLGFTWRQGHRPAHASRRGAEDRSGSRAPLP